MDLVIFYFVVVQKIKINSKFAATITAPHMLKNLQYILNNFLN